MADKSFGVRQLNILGSGTPSIDSQGDLNLNANKVAISTNLTVGGASTFTGDVSIGGTLTYEDVTNVDSIGLITARTGVRVSAGGMVVAGVSTFSNDLDINASINVFGLSDLAASTFNNVRAGWSADNEIDTSSGNLILDSAGGTVEVTDNLTVSNDITANGNIIGDAEGLPLQFN